MWLLTLLLLRENCSFTTSGWRARPKETETTQKIVLRESTFNLNLWTEREELMGVGDLTGRPFAKNRLH